MAPSSGPDLDQYTVGIICPLPIELAAATAMLDEQYADGEQDASDHNSYKLGRIGDHQIVIASLPAGQSGISSAATVSKDMLRTFKSIRFGLLVGIGGGIPSTQNDIRLGDVVISVPNGYSHGTIQILKATKDSIEYSNLNSPPTILLAAINKIKAEMEYEDSKIPQYLSDMIKSRPKMKKFVHQGNDKDVLYQSAYIHRASSVECSECSHSYQILRQPREDAEPRVHYGTIASSDVAIEDGTIRDLLQKQEVICFETEAAGLKDFPSLVIRGISDYTDSHKNEIWQRYAAATAMATAKDLLDHINPAMVSKEQRIFTVSDPIQHQILREQLHMQQKVALRYEDEQQEQCHQYFNVCPYAEYKDINPYRADGTCLWALKNPLYEKWRENQHDDLLWVSADPGCGKSVLAKSLIDKELGNSITHTVCYFFFKDNDDQNGLARALCSMLHSLYGQKPELLRHATQTWKSKKQTLQNEPNELWSLLLASATDPEAGNVTCVFDALDECEAKDRKVLIKQLTDFYSESMIPRKGHLKFLVTSRPYHEIKVEFGMSTQLPTIHLAGEEKNDEISGEINTVIRQKVAQISQQHNLDPDTTKRLEERLLSVPNRTYLWLQVVTEGLLFSIKHTPKEYARLIDNLPTKVEDAYERILSKNQGTKKYECEVLLHIILSARRALTLEEMDLAFHIGLSDSSKPPTSYTDLDLAVNSLKEYIRHLCGLFVFVHESRIYFIHQTAKDFLVTRQAESQTGIWRHSLGQLDSETMLARICINYLNLVELDDEEFDSNTDTLQPVVFQFLNYSASHWASHYTVIQYDTQRYIIEDVLKLYRPNSSIFRTWFSVLWKNHTYQGSPSLNAVQCAAFNGHVQVLKALISLPRSEPDSKDRAYNRTALAWAAEMGHAEVVKVLMGIKGINVNSKDQEGRSPLLLAARNGHEAVVRLLINAQGITLNSKDGFGRTPFLWAAKNGHEAVVRLLIDTPGVDLNAKDRPGRTPLLWAIQQGNLDVIKLLVNARGIDINYTNKRGLSPLSWATENNHEAVVRLLINTHDNLDLNSRDRRGRSPLIWAVQAGNAPMVKLISSIQGVDLNLKDSKGLSPFACAVRAGDESVVKVLSSVQGVNLNFRDPDGLSPFSWAVQNENMAMVRLLGSMKGVDLNILNQAGVSPLSWAVRNGNEPLVKLLVSIEGVDPNYKDTSQEAPLFLAVRNGHKAIVRLLINTTGIDLNSQNALFDETPLFLAIKNGHEAIIQLLINAPGIDLNPKDYNKETPLLWALKNGHETIFQLLVNTPGIDLNCGNFSSDTPLLFAAENGNEAIVKQLINMKDIDINYTNSTKRTALSWAAQNGNEAIVKLLLDSPGIDANSEDYQGRTPLSWAAQNGHEAVFKLLLQTGADVKSKDNLGKTALSWAAQMGHEVIVKLLLETEGIDVNSQDDQGRTPLSWAVRYNRTAVVELLTRETSIELDGKDKKNSHSTHV